MARNDVRYMTVAVDRMPDGLNLCCWFSTVDFYMSEVKHYPHSYELNGDACKWHIHANEPLSEKTLWMVTEYADDQCAIASKRNQQRPIVNAR